MRGRRGHLAIALAGVVLALGIVVARLLIDGRTAWLHGAAAEQRGETAQAIRHYLDAGRMYVPGSPYTARSLDRLDAIAVAAVTRSDRVHWRWARPTPAARDRHCRHHGFGAHGSGQWAQ